MCFHVKDRFRDKGKQKNVSLGSVNSKLNVAFHNSISFVSLTSQQITSVFTDYVCTFFLLEYGSWVIFRSLHTGGVCKWSALVL